MSIDDKVLEAALQRAKLEPEVAAALRQIFAHNCDTCRSQKFLDEGMNPAAYVERLIRYYGEWHAHVHRLQVEKALDVWEPFYGTLQKWAYAFLARREFGTPEQRWDHAAACAAEAAAILLDTNFPFDVNFESWAYVILQNVCLRRLDKEWGSADALAKNPVPLDEFDGWLGNLAASSLAGATTDEVTLADLRHDLLDAISELASDARQEFIMLYYFEQRTFDDISGLMGRSKGTLYKLHFDALENLRAIWEEKQNNHE